MTGNRLLDSTWNVQICNANHSVYLPVFAFNKRYFYFQGSPASLFFDTSSPSVNQDKNHFRGVASGLKWALTSWGPWYLYILTKLNIHSFFLRAFSTTLIFDFSGWWKSCHGINLCYSVANGSPLIILLPTLIKCSDPDPMRIKPKNPTQRHLDGDQDYSFIQEKRL